MAVEEASLFPKDPSQNFMASHVLPLDAFFEPKSVAVVGAKDDAGTVGRTIMANLLYPGFKGKVYPINPKRSEVLGQRCYPSLDALPEAVDLAVIVTPSATVPKLIAQCGSLGIKAAIVISAGFKELGAQGLALEQAVLAEAKRGGVRIIGPNCLGVMNPLCGFNATFAKGMALPGSLAFISQSGAMCTTVLDWSLQRDIGFSAFVSIGSMADIDWGDLISYLGAQPTTRSILLYMETIGNARSFLTAAREIALEKPIIAIKPGRSQQAAQAAASHTGSLAGSDEVLEAAFERVGVLRVDSIRHLFSTAEVLARQPLPKGPRLTIVTNAGGPSVLATDAAVLNGADIAPLDPGTIAALDAILPAAWSHGNPVDILGDALPERYGQAIDILMKDTRTDGILAILSPQDVTDPSGTAKCLIPYGKNGKKPILASWMGGDSVREGIEILSQGHIPNFEYSDDAAWTFATMWRYSHHLKELYEVPEIRAADVGDAARQQVSALIAAARHEGRTLLAEHESKSILASYGIPCVQTLIAHTAQEAVAIAETLGYPVVVKLFSQTITHKSDIGGVKLNLIDASAVGEAFIAIERAVTANAGPQHFQGVAVQPMIRRDEGYELILGSSNDLQFGPVLLFGTGGQLVEVYRDRALALPPLNANLARRLMSKTKVFEALQGVRGRSSVDIARIEQILVHFSQLIVENLAIKECDINPLFVSSQHIIALDARIVLYGKEEPLPSLAIRPYPSNYIAKGKLLDGTDITLRPIRPEDEPATVAFHHELSENSVRQRYFEFISLSERIAHERLVRICFNDYDRELAIVAESPDLLIEGRPTIVGIGRISREAIAGNAELTMIIADAYHNKGLGTLLLQHLLECAKGEGIKRISALILSENSGMIHLCRKFNFQRQKHADPLMTSLVCVL